MLVVLPVVAAAAPRRLGPKVSLSPCNKMSNFLFQLLPVGMPSINRLGFLRLVLRREVDRSIRVRFSSEPRSRDEQSSMGRFFGTLLVLSQCYQDVEGMFIRLPERRYQVFSVCKLSVSCANCKLVCLSVRMANILEHFPMVDI